jgi:hypothetical protein
MIKTTMSRRLCHWCCCNSHDHGSTIVATTLVIPIFPILELTLLKEILVVIFILFHLDLGLFVDSKVFLSAKLLSKLPLTKKNKGNVKMNRKIGPQFCCYILNFLFSLLFAALELCGSWCNEGCYNLNVNQYGNNKVCIKKTLLILLQLFYIVAKLYTCKWCSIFL